MALLHWHSLLLFLATSLIPIPQKFPPSETSGLHFQEELGICGYWKRIGEQYKDAQTVDEIIILSLNCKEHSWYFSENGKRVSQGKWKLKDDVLKLKSKDQKLEWRILELKEDTLSVQDNFDTWKFVKLM